MRDPNRIPEICALLESTWKIHPDMRLGQLLVNALRPSQACPQIFYAEESAVREGLHRMRGAPPISPPSPRSVAIDWSDAGTPAPSTVELLGVQTGDFEVAEGYCELLRVKFGGPYRDGSQGNPDARFMVRTIGALLAAHEPDVVLLDLSAMSYAWGDGIVGVLQLIRDFDGNHPIGAVVLAGPASAGGLGSLLSRVFTDETEAIAEAAGLAIWRARDIG